MAGWLEVQPDFAPLGAFARRYDTPEGDEVRLVEPGGDEIELDAPSAAKLPGPGVVLAVVVPGPFALPGPPVSIPEDVVEEMSELVDAGSPDGLAARLGAKFGWTASPDLSSTRSRKAGAVAAAR